MRLFFLLFAALLTPVMAIGEPVVVRGGEHADFTRLVLDVPRSVKWNLEQAEDLRLKLEGIRADYVVQDALKKLSANRVLSVAPSSNGSELVIALNCDCDVKSFYAGPKMLVVDIYGDPSVQQTVATNASLPSSGQIMLDAEQPSDGFELPLFTSTALASTSPSGSTRLAETVSQDSAKELGDTAKRLVQTKAQLITQFSRVASQGLLTTSGNTPLPVERDQPEATPDLPLPQSEHSVVPDPEGLNLRAISSVDRDYLLSGTPPRFSVNGERCMADDVLDVQNWAGGEDFSERVGSLRLKLVGEFDKKDATTAIELAKTYIHYGFGAEALQTLNDIELPPSLGHLRAMADIVEDGELREGTIGGWHYDCETSAALWAALSSQPISAEIALNQAALLRSFGALSPSLRAHLGPSLYTSLKADVSPTSELLDKLASLMERGRISEDPAVQLVAADMLIAHGDAEKALQSLDEVIETNGPDAPKALVKKIDTFIAAGSAVPTRYQELALAYAHEYRRDQLGSELARVNILALASASRFDDAYSALEAESEASNSPPSKETASFFLKMLTQNSEDVTFLKHSFEVSRSELSLDPEIENLTARRLIKLGFPEPAAAFLDAAAGGDIGRARLLLRATVALQQGRPRQAEVELLGLSGREVEGLRARARVMGDNHKGARLSFAMLGERELAAEQAWLGSEWEQLRTQEAPEWAPEQSFVSTVAPPAIDEEKVLASGRALLADSSALRQTIGNILARHELTEAMREN